MHFGLSKSGHSPVIPQICLQLKYILSGSLPAWETSCFMPSSATSRITGSLDKKAHHLHSLLTCESYLDPTNATLGVFWKCAKKKKQAPTILSQGPEDATLLIGLGSKWRTSNLWKWLLDQWLDSIYSLPLTLSLLSSHLFGLTYWCPYFSLCSFAILCFLVLLFYFGLHTCSLFFLFLITASHHSNISGK